MTNKTTPPHVLDIANSAQCCYCGACLGVCPGGDRSNLIIDSFEREGWHLSVVDEDRCAPCTLCRDACPMNVVDYKELESQVFAEKEHMSFESLLGYYRKGFIARSTNQNRLDNSASGGVVSELIHYLFENKQIDGVLALQPGGANPIDYNCFIAGSYDEWDGSQGSHYFPIPVMTALEQIMIGKFRNVAIIGIPCQITALRLAQKRMKKLERRIFCTIGGFCGGTTTFKLIDYLESRLDPTDIKQVASIRFRAGKWPGNIKVKLRDGRERWLDGIERDFQSYTTMLPACLYCADHFNELADISVGDPWLQDIIDRDDGGYSIAIGRTEHGLGLLSELINESRISVETITAERMVRSQRGPMDYKKRGLKPRIALKALFPAKIPRIEGARLIKTDILDYINAFVLLVLLRITRLRLYWKIVKKLPSNIVILINKPVYFLQKRHNLQKRIVKKLLTKLRIK